MNSTMNYEKLYNNMVKKFTIEKDNKDYTLGDYMLMKAQTKKNAMTVAEAALPVAHEQKLSTAISGIFSYVNEKLKVKEAPVRDKTIRKFPLRTSFAAFGSALVICAFAVGCAVFGLSAVNGRENIVSVTDVDSEPQEYAEEFLTSDFGETI